MQIDQKIFDDLTKSIKDLNRSIRSGGAPGRSAPGTGPYNTTRFTTPDIGGFRAFFSTAIGTDLINRIVDRGFKRALTDQFQEFTGRDVKKKAVEDYENALNQLKQKTIDAKDELDKLVNLSPSEKIRKRLELDAEEVGKTALLTRDRDRKMLKGNLLAMRNFGIAIFAATGAVLAFRQMLVNSARELGGVTLDQALRNKIDTLFESAISFIQGEFVTFGGIERVQGAIAQEFGLLPNAQEGRRLAQLQIRLGLTVGELVKLQRALQGTGIEAEEAINEFRDVGIVGRVAAQEIAKNADAVARAGDRFNEFIVQGVRNVRRLGLEFSKIESTLTGFATDLEGTVDSFANARALLPGFATDFNQLFATALTGTTDEFIDQIRSSLLGAGVTDVSQLNRAQLAALQQATGFGAAELNRILGNENPFQDEALDLDTKRNQLINKTNILLGVLIGATIGARLAPGPFGAVGGAIGGAIGGGLTANFLPKLFDDFVFRPGAPPVKFNKNDTIIGVKKPEDLQHSMSTSVDTRLLENKMDRLINTMEQQTALLRSGMALEVRDLDKAIIRNNERALRNF